MPDITQTAPGWFCFSALPKKEHLAADLLRREEGIRTFCPRISVLRNTRRGKVRFVECLFPGYLFVHADLSKTYRWIRSTAGVRDIVAFGDRIPPIPEAFIEDLKARLGGTEDVVVDVPEPELKPGTAVTITEGPFRNWNAIVSGDLDAHQRVSLLLDFLGRQMELKVPAENVLPPEEQPGRRLWTDQR